MIKYIFTLGFVIISIIDIYPQSGWVVQNAPSTLYLNSIQFVNSETGYTIGTDYNSGNFVFLKTTNGGGNWISQYSGSNTHKNPMNLFFTDALTGYSVGGDAWLGEPSCFFRTTNGGINWVSMFLQDTTVYRGIYFINSNTGFIAGSFGYLLKTTNMGYNWIRLNSGTPEALNSIYFINDNTGFIAGSNGTIIKTTDSGNNWINQNSNSILWLRSIFFTNNNLGFVCGNSSYGSSNTILKTTNSGNNWDIILVDSTFSANYFKSLYFTSNDEGYVCSSYKIMKTTNSGDSWFNLDLPVNNFIQTMFGYSISFANTNTGYICGKIGSAAILKTINAGISTIPAMPTRLRLFQSNNPRRINLAWDDNSYIENGYKIERRVGIDTMWITIDSVSTNVTNYIDYNVEPGATYFYRVYSYNENGRSDYSNTASITITVTSVNLIEDIVGKEYSINQNYPNPFNSNTVIRYQLPVDSKVSIKVYDVQGREIRTLVNERMQAGSYQTDWDASAYPSGVYFYKMTTGDFSETRRMVLIK